ASIPLSISIPAGVASYVSRPGWTQSRSSSALSRSRPSRASSPRAWPFAVRSRGTPRIRQPRRGSADPRLLGVRRSARFHSPRFRSLLGGFYRAGWRRGAGPMSPAAAARLGATGVEVLESLGQHRLLSTRQIHQLHTPHATIRWSRYLLARLRANGLAAATARPGGMLLWYLTGAGFDSLDAIPSRPETRPPVACPHPPPP